MSLCTLSPLFPHHRRTAYYCSQIIANLRFLYPEIQNLDIVTAPGCVYIVSTAEGGRQVVVHRRRYLRIFPGAMETALRAIYRTTVREVRGKVKMLGDDVFFDGGMWVMGKEVM